MSGTKLFELLKDAVKAKVSLEASSKEANWIREGRLNVFNDAKKKFFEAALSVGMSKGLAEKEFCCLYEKETGQKTLNF
jgi:hypothetical protein